MKKKIATAILIAAAAVAFANEPTQSHSFSANDLPMEKKIAAGEKISSAAKSFTYLRMGVTDTVPTTNSVHIVPGLGVGHRISTGDGAVDVSANYTRGQWAKGENASTYFYTLPKASYLHYLSPAKHSSLYAGAGLAFGGLRNKDGAEFTGLIPSATVGYEMNRNADVRSFVQLDVSQPAIAAKNLIIKDWSGNADFFEKAPIAEISFGFGY
jgi:hypothetical protein